MKKLLICFSLVFAMACGGNSDGGGNPEDSVSTDSLRNPSYNPEAKTDSAIDHMNLDSSKVDSPSASLPE